MAVFPQFQLPVDALKIRFQEPFTSEGLNLKTSGILPAGIYQGFIPSSPVAPANLLVIDPEPGPIRDDSVAVIDVIDPSGIRPIFNTTVRTREQIILDFTGHVTFPVEVVIRANYQISANPFSGLSDAKIVVVDPGAPLGDPTAKLDGDIVIAEVTGLGAPLSFNTINRQITAVGGGFTHSEIVDTSGPIATGGSLVFVPTGLPPLAFNLPKPQSVLIGLECSIFTPTSGTDYIVMGLSVDAGPVVSVGRSGNAPPSPVFTSVRMITGCRAVSLSAGPHTIDTYFKTILGGAVTSLLNDPDGPTRLTAVYST